MSLVYSLRIPFVLYRITMRSLMVGVLLAGSALAVTLPSYITPCDSRLPDFDVCMLKLSQSAVGHIVKEGDPQFNIPKLDPLLLERIQVGDAALGQRAVGMSFTCKNCTLKGLEGAQLLRVENRFKDQQIKISGRVPKMHLKGDYAISGKVLLLPIVGEGKAAITLTDVGFDYTTPFKLVKGKDGKDYLKVTNSSIAFNVDGFNMHLTNLFNGDKALGDQMNSFLNENWQEMLKEFGPALGRTVSDIITLIINNICDKIPISEMIIS